MYDKSFFNKYEYSLSYFVSLGGQSIDKRTKEYQHILRIIDTLNDPDRLICVIEMGYPASMACLRFNDINKLNSFCEN